MKRTIVNIVQAIPEFRGKKRIFRFLLNLIRQNERSIQVSTKSGIRYFLPNTIENISFELLVNGSYEPETVNFISAKLPPQATLLDIGANIGAISIPVAKMRPDVRIINVEASTRMFDFLTRNIRLNQLSNCLALHHAVADTNDQTVNFFSPEDKFGKGSMAPVFTQIGHHIRTITIDQIWEQYTDKSLHFIKIDIEGFEYFAFKGGEAVLCKNDAPDILFEFVDWAEEHASLPTGMAQQLLLDFGYRLYLINGHKSVLMNKPQRKGSAMIFATKHYV